ncbi:ubiquinone/menaquinone biosynthesis-related protein [Cordyceps fumosorosea ARSEF 2679]|uniref:Ubiquinone/menaquinone biosynthesis-related protein n=1 Tax=Cordyceps fumosorosea (strain ARSEF 2679) TaxID=1081104 RepID=A0A162LH44_CORFA|nr:ubiquinone/menaquinone biosynthesis-related protein [Cordyceps fumosorosea ARSEF 2679]OAA70514.1 ubiquinone/menaquinone biosynthesis-related protein [Cordyceps fumosorosea ARSEF 2679]
MNPCVTTRRACAAVAAARGQCARRWAHIESGPGKPRLGSKSKPKAPGPTPYKPCALPLPPRPSRASPTNLPRQRTSQVRPRPPPLPKSKPQPPADTLLSVWRATWLPLSGAALVAGALGFYIFGTAAASLQRPCPACHSDHQTTPTGRPPALTGDNAEQFDKELDWPEYWMGITGLRRRLAAHARGDVLELAMGSGRNLAHYDWSPIEAALVAAAAAATADEPRRRENVPMRARQGITSFTGLDISADMLDVARRKLTETVPPLKDAAVVVRAAAAADSTGGHLSLLDGRLRLVRSDAHHALPPAPSFGPNGGGDSKYDSVMQTFGLCSVADPVAVLRNLATVVKPGTGRIVLLEHGRGHLGLVNGLLDRHAGRHFDKYGCWWNRDIQAIVEEAAAAAAAEGAPRLTVVRVERPKVLQLGTLVWVELKVEEDPAAAGKK